MRYPHFHFNVIKVTEIYDRAMFGLLSILIC